MKLKQWMVVGVMVGVAAAGGWAWSVRGRPAPAPKAPPVPELPFQVRPATDEEMKKTREPAPKKPKAPIQVRFKAAGQGALEEAIPVELVVEADTETLPAGLAGEEVTLEYLLRLPQGVQLKSDGWTPVELSPEEKEDPTGAWSLFERKITRTAPAKAETAEWAREKIALAVTEKGANWVITTRVRLTWGSLSWQTFGAVFASVDERGGVEFHTVPRVPATEQRAQAN